MLLLVNEPLLGEEVVDLSGLVHVDVGEAPGLGQPEASPLLTLLNCIDLMYNY